MSKQFKATKSNTITRILFNTPHSIINRVTTYNKIVNLDIERHPVEKIIFDGENVIFDGEQVI